VLALLEAARGEREEALAQLDTVLAIAPEYAQGRQLQRRLGRPAGAASR
jgi:hypothetical protein